MADIPKILAVDDEADIAELVSYNLKKEGFAVSTASDATEALEKLASEDFSLVLLDLMLPGMQGLELCRVLKKDPKTEHLPIIMVTAKAEEVDRILGLESGADDYISKPFSTRELIARIRAVLRRTAPKSSGDVVMKVGSLLINREAFSITKDGRLLDLSATEIKLLLYLIEKRGKIFNREQLLKAVWKHETYVDPRTIDVHVRRLRTQIEDDPSNPVYIKTKRGIGYYFDA